MSQDGNIGFATGTMNSMDGLGSRASHQSKDSGGLKVDNFVYIEVDVLYHEGDGGSGEGTSVAHKNLGFDMQTSVPKVMHEVCSYIDMEAIKPMYLFCKNKATKLTDGTLQSHGVENDFVFELHICKDMNDDEDGESSMVDSKTFVSKLKPKTVYLSVLLFDVGKRLLVTKSGMLPTIELTNESAIADEFSVENKEFLWARTKSCDWEESAMQAVNRGMNEDAVFSAAGLATTLQ